MRATQFDALLAAVEEWAENDAAGPAVDCDGLRVSADDGGYTFSTHEAKRSGLSEGELHDLADEHAAYVTNWYYWTHAIDAADPAREAFLRWIEGAPLPAEGADHGDESADEADRHRSADEADQHRLPPEADRHRSAPEVRPVPERYDALRKGVTAGWGELSIRVEVDDDGLRTYEVRHEDDADADRADLEAHEDPLDARDLVETDSKGRYRPLKTAPSLRTGWTFVDLDGHELVQCVDYVYPATVANWYRERRGELDVDHWTATAERQTGIYEVIEEMDREAVEWMAEACCVDSQCLKRREWEFDEGDELAVDGGDGVFPCREPCSLVIAAARRWTTLESESEKTYQLELTTSEMNQLSEIVDAVADGRTDEIREADVYEGANRYRARFLRAKRFEDGELPAIELEDS